MGKYLRRRFKRRENGLTLTREKQLKMIETFIDENGVTQLPRDARLQNKLTREEAVALNEAAAQAFRDAGPLAKKKAEDEEE